MFICDALAPRHADAATDGVCEAEILAAARTWGVPPGILHSVGLTETGRKGALYPYALNIEGRTVYARNRGEALRAFERARAEGKTLIDLGCMQINHRYHGAEFTSVDAMLDPRANVEYAARFLARLHDRHETWTMAVARYHAGPNNDPAQKRYVCRVISNLIASGHGAWTSQADSFCNGHN
ncbi:transglycosylase SLT domain-containing protein [Hoeflea sp. YIM 152468]|uniref:transglycosylase SLT domain-containing protein n=1 Tax=Hoeflea sp. YIM 152468 TaxID=3031759 RepID=UPI0023DB5F5B|nr:transglycosylase SLT domain-containing protein [Hoeflea sp. YIM 152468]MDF1610109.1 transglycosylase SLT domain-containing protein [Hoeflea sp. YIM 152468]